MATVFNPTKTTVNGRINKARKPTMKKMVTSATLMLFGLYLSADEVKQPYIIQRGEERIEVHNMPTFTVSEPISNSFVYINGEYIPPPYVVSVSNLAVLINGIIVQNDEPIVHKREYYTGRVGATPENVGRSLDESAQDYVDGLKFGIVQHLANGGRIKSSRLRDDGSALALIEKARKAEQGNEQAKQQLMDELGLTTRQHVLRPDWIERLANNTNLETRATAIIEAKSEKERLERERREQMNKKDEKKP